LRILSATSKICKIMSVDENPKEAAAPTVSALERGVAVLRCFTETQRVLTPTELARLTGVPRPTVTRLASTLVALGLMKQDPQTEAFMLGPGVVSLARVFLAGLDIRAAARPHMAELADATGGTAYLAVPDGLDMVLIEACRPRTTMLTPRLDVGSRVPLATSALGRAWLWAHPPDQREAIIQGLRLARGPESGASEKGLRQALAEADHLGYCVSAGDYVPEINSVAVPLVGPNGDVMAINCGSAAFVFGEDHLRQQVAPRLLETAHALSADIGGHVPQPA
jgi:IclR family transcriptional regulator, positive regulator for flagellar biogenesis